MPRPMIRVTPNFTDIETRIAKGERVTVKHIAEEMNVSPTVVRRAIESHYTNRVVFKKGRTGGIELKAKETETAMAT